MRPPDAHSSEPWSAPGPEGSTPLDPDETEGLIPSWIATRGDLDRAEQENILYALASPRWRRIGLPDLLDDLTARALHKDMFGQVWTWAGTYRTTERNIGIDPWTISVAVRDLMDDAKLWLAGAHPLAPDVVGYRFHHRLVQIHPFPNGNGRHSRAMTDLLIRSLGSTPFSWGSANVDRPTVTRGSYIAALRAADKREFDLLAAFVRG
jgi:Fic-DOC domain mobile mystery protein B